MVAVVVTVIVTVIAMITSRIVELPLIVRINACVIRMMPVPVGVLWTVGLIVMLMAMFIAMFVTIFVAMPLVMFITMLVMAALVLTPVVSLFTLDALISLIVAGQRRDRNEY